MMSTNLGFRECVQFSAVAQMCCHVFFLEIVNQSFVGEGVGDMDYQL